MDQVAPEHKMWGANHPTRTGEKQLLRDAFGDLLPEFVAKRVKIAFSEGVGSSWADGLQSRAEKIISDSDFAQRAKLFPINTPHTKEAFLYRRIFESKFGKKDSVIETVMYHPTSACSTEAALQWDQRLLSAAQDGSGKGLLK